MAETDIEIGKSYVEILARMDKLYAGFKQAQQESDKTVSKMQQSFNKLQLKFSDAVFKMKIKDVEKLHKQLQAEFQKRIALNADVEAIERTRIKLKSVEDALKDINAKAPATGKGMDNLFNMAKLAAIAYTLKEVATAIFNISLAGAQLANLKEAFQGTEADIQNFRNATAGTVNDANLLKLSNQATDLGISLEKQALLFALAENAGDKYGTGVEEGFQKVVSASEGNIRGLKALGVQKEVYEAQVKELAAAHGAEIDKLDAETQKQIRLEAVIKASGITMADVTAKMQDNADKMESATVAWANFKNVIGELLGPGVSFLLNNFVEGLQRILGLTDEVEKAINKNSGNIQVTYRASLQGMNQKQLDKEFQALTEQKFLLQSDYNKGGLSTEQENIIRSQLKTIDIQRQTILAYSKEINAPKSKGSGVITGKKDIEDLSKKLYDGLNKSSEEYYTGQMERINKEAEAMMKQNLGIVKINQYKAEQIKALDKDVHDAKMAMLAKEIDAYRMQAFVETHGGKTFADLTKKGGALDITSVGPYQKNHVPGELGEKNMDRQDPFRRYDLEEFYAENSLIADAMNSTADNLANSWNSVMNDMLSGTRSFSEGVQGLFTSLGMSIIQTLEQIGAKYAAITTISALGSLIPGVGTFSTIFSFLSGRAAGGPVSAGTPYIVGERGRELFVPQTSGYIVPNNVLQKGGIDSTGKIVQALNILNARVANMIINNQQNPPVFNIFNNAPDIKTQVIRNEQVKARLVENSYNLDT